MSKLQQLELLYEKYKEVYKDKEVVLGEGNVNTKILLIGEAPGRDEVKQSRPFVGAAGKNLNEFLELLGIKRDDIYITNAIKYRLGKVNPTTGNIINRPATIDEIRENQEYLMREISIIMPGTIVTLGNVPLKSVTGDITASIGDCHGQLKTVDYNGQEFSLFPLYHPASIIYNSKLKEVYKSDLEKLGHVVSK